MKRTLPLILLLVSIHAYSQISVTGTSASISAANNGTAVVVDNAIIISTAYTIPGFRVRISGNFNSGDVLSYTGSLPSGVTANYSSGVLTFSGSSTALNYQTLLRTVTFNTTSATTTNRTITFEAYDPSIEYFSTNNHWYSYVAGTFSWTSAKASAQARNFFGAAGYLATVTSIAENTFVLSLSGKGWLGGSDEYTQINAATGTTTFANQAASEGKWYWVTGPEKGTLFSNVAVATTYANWLSGEPNNSGNTEHYVENSWGSGSWNDSQNSGSIGYILEFGGTSGDPTVDVFHTRDITMIATQLKTNTPLKPYTLRSPAVVVDPLVTVTSTGNMTDAKVTISGNFKSGDALSYSGSLPSGVTVSGTGYNSTTGVLSFSGTTSPTNWQNLFRTVTFSSSSTVVGNRDVTFSVGNQVANSNGHFYESVTTGTTWTNAKTAAAAKTYMGLQGYLVTITSAAENDFIKQKIGTDAWIGLSDAYTEINAATGTTTYANQTAAEGKFYWISGPEKGTMITTGNAASGSVTGAAVSGQFTNWNLGEPNNWGGSESYGEMYAVGSAPGKWNDLNGTQSLMYVVEYGGLPSDPMITLSANTVIVNNSVLPVTGLDVNVEQGINLINVNWSTLTELNCDRFDVLHSTDGVVFNKIGSVKGHGNTEEKQFYSYVHRTPSYGINYYKLQQFDYDSKYKYSPVKQLNFGNMQTLLSPNPAHAKITIFHQRSGSDESLIIYSMGGKVMHKTKLAADKTYVDIQSFPTGLYLAEIKDRLKSTRIMFVKQ